MSNITVNVTNAGTTNLAVSNGSTFNATVGNGGSVSVGIGSISPGNATVVSGTLTINSTTTLAAGSNATVTNNGTAYAAVLDFGIPAGGFSNISVGNVTTLSPGSSATVAAAANGGNVALSFGLPAGPAPAFAIGKVTTLNAGSSANVTLSTANNGANVTLDFGIPRGVDGTGTSNVQLSNAAPANLGTAAVGTSNLAARADHVHNVPVIAYADLSGVPANFPTNVTLVSGLSSAYAAANHAHNYVETLNNLAGAITLAAGPNVTLSSSNLTITIDSTAGLGAGDAIDGGNYAGEILGGITFSVQPQSVTVNVATNLAFTSFSPSSAINSANVAALGSAVFAADVQPGGNVTLVSSSDDGQTWANVLEVAASPTFVERTPAQIASNGTRHVFTTGVRVTQAGATYSQLRYSDNASLSSSALVVRAGTSANLENTYSVAYSAQSGRWVASTHLGIFSSSDGYQWTFRTFTSAWGLKVASVGQSFVAVGGGQLQRSDNGTSWTQVSPVPWSSGYPASADVASSGSRAVVVAQGQNDVAASGDPPSLVPANPTTAWYTTDGMSWGAATTPLSCNRVDYAKGLFWAWPSSSTNAVCTSPDGVAWTLRSLPANGAIGGIAGINPANAIMASSSGTAYVVSIGSVAGSANLTALASASSGAAVSYQWQQSLDAGSTWSNVANQTATSLNLTGLTLAESGTRYRVQASATGAATQSSQTAILTVTE